MAKRVELTGAVGFLAAVVAVVVGVVLWRYGALPGLRGGFEGERDWSLLYVELPVMLFGFPAVTLVTWRFSRSLLSCRAGWVTRAVVPVVAVCVAVVVLAWASLTWLHIRVAPFVHPG
ncbi:MULTISPECIES: hypothetical protein [Streptomyces]|uniref:Uncharacterized protein n=1 Tax=Streptomyces ramulosus TaxID=47762 RepID=A0ABW1FDK9_9ACTN